MSAQKKEKKKLHINKTIE